MTEIIVSKDKRCYSDKSRLVACQAGRVFLAGDALGLAQPLTGEGILPAVLSGKLCATAILEDRPETYRQRLRAHPIISGDQVLQSGQKLLAKYLKYTHEPPLAASY